ncbi:hypothetical protein P692DRAFT_201894902 [Suillus brevipes Sb2]|nr:hypothetical protein P692DRAFT_201894902 [Suillus brevipes Sb2]
MSHEDRDIVERMFAEATVDVQPESMYSALSGTEEVELSHEGGEHEAFEGLAQEMADISGCHYMDPRTRTDRIQLQNTHWDLQWAVWWRYT